LQTRHGRRTIVNLLIEAAVSGTLVEQLLAESIILIKFISYHLVANEIRGNKSNDNLQILT